MTNLVISFLTMGAEEFGQWLRERRKKQYLTVEALAKRAGISKQYLSILERAAVQALTGKPAKPTVGVVDRIAKALNIPADEARLAAGYAPTKAVRRPESIEELVTALESLGIDAPQTIEAFPYDPDGEGFREITERIWLDIQLVINRMKRGHKPPRLVSMHITDIEEIENERIAEIKHGT